MPDLNTLTALVYVLLVWLVLFTAFIVYDRRQPETVARARVDARTPRLREQVILRGNGPDRLYELPVRDPPLPVVRAHGDLEHAYAFTTVKLGRKLYTLIKP